MRISDWSSDVCSSDLRFVELAGHRQCAAQVAQAGGLAAAVADCVAQLNCLAVLLGGVGGLPEPAVADPERVDGFGLAIEVAAALELHQRAHQVVIDRAPRVAAEDRKSPRLNSSH